MKVTYPTELVEKAEFELKTFERVSMDTGAELLAELKLHRAFLLAAGIKLRLADKQTADVKAKSLSESPATDVHLFVQPVEGESEEDYAHRIETSLTNLGLAGPYNLVFESDNESQPVCPTVITMSATFKSSDGN